MLNEILAKLNANEKLIGVGTIVAVVGWLFGLLFTNSGGASWYGSSNAEGLGLISVIAAVAAVVVIYLKNAPNTKIAWPAPVPMILLALAAVAVICGLLGLLEALTYDPYSGLSAAACALAASYGGSCPSKPITVYLAAGAVLVGGAMMAYAAYMEYSKKAA